MSVTRPTVRPAHRLICAVLALTLLGGCASKLNPLNWFAKRAPTMAAVNLEKPADPRPLIGSVLSVRVEKVPTGRVVTAVGRGTFQGSYRAALVAQEPVDGALVLEFRAFSQPGAPLSTPVSREITVALHLTPAELAAVRTITVQSGGNTISMRP